MKDSEVTNYILIGYVIQEPWTPCFVLPVVIDKSTQQTRVIAYTGHREYNTYPMEDEFIYSPFTEIDNFQPWRTKLIALKAKDIRLYDLFSQDLFFRILLMDPGFARNNPFFRFELASQLSDHNLKYQEFCKCTNKIKHEVVRDRFVKEADITHWPQIISDLNLQYDEEKYDRLVKSSPSWMIQKINRWNKDPDAIWKGIWTILYFMGLDEDTIQNVLLYCLEKSRFLNAPPGFFEDHIYQYQARRYSANLETD